MTASGAWQCASSNCHGGFQQPKVSSSASTTYSTLAAYKIFSGSKSLPFIAPGNTDPTASGIECNLSSTRCGSQMPLTIGGARALTSQDVANIDAWVRCGSPQN
jgi:hypothetical protein